MRRNAIPTAPGHLRGGAGSTFCAARPGLIGTCRPLKRRLAFAIVLLLAGCGRPHSAALEVRHNPHSVTLSWVASTSPVAGYNVYRSFPPGAPFMKLTPQPVAGTQYIDTTAEAGNTYTYYVTSVDSKGVESRPSGKTVATVPIP